MRNVQLTPLQLSRICETQEAVDAARQALARAEHDAQVLLELVYDFYGIAPGTDAELDRGSGVLTIAV